MKIFKMIRGFSLNSDQIRNEKFQPECFPFLCNLHIKPQLTMFIPHLTVSLFDILNFPYFIVV